MTADERFERIEATLETVGQMQLSIAARQIAREDRQDAWQQKFDKAMDGIVESQAANQKSLATLVESITRYVDAADSRLKQMEQNLDNLIRIITAEHSNGKSKH